MNLIIANGFNQIHDGSGVFGGIFHYALIFALVGSAFIIFIYLWSKGRLDMDEEPKLEMMRKSEQEDSCGKPRN